MKIEKIAQWSYLVVCRHLIINCIFLLNIAFSLDFSKCKEYYKQATKDFGGISALHLGNGQYLAYSNKLIKNDKLTKSSPILGLYLFRDENIPYKFELKEIKNDIKIIAINKDLIINGEILQNQNSIKDLAIFNKNMPQNSVLSDICYQIYGISTNNNRFNTKKYIDLFLKNPDSAFSYIGIEIDKNLTISKINPLIIKHIKLGDKIQSINNQTIESKSNFVDKITILPPNTQIELKINDISYIVTTLPLYSPFSTQSTYLEALGITIDNDLIITKIATNNHFKQNDRILKINQIDIKNIDDIDSAIDSTLEDNLNILVLRKNFEFFINIQKPRNIDEKNIN